MIRFRLGSMAMVGVVLGVAACGSSNTPNPVPARIVVVPDTVRLVQGATQQLNAMVKDGDGNTIDGTITWTGGSVATVSATGLLTSIAAGQGTVTATAGTVSTDVPVVITGHPEGVQGPRLPLTNRPFGVAVGGDSVLLATQLDGGTVGKSRTNLATFPGSIVVGSVPTDVTFSANSLEGYVTNQGTHDVGVLSVPAGSQPTSVAVPGDPFRVRRGTGSIVYVTGNADSVFAINTVTQQIVGRVAVGLDPNGIAISADGSRLYVTNLSSGDLSEVNTGTMAVVRTITLGGVPQDVVVSPDGTELYVANEAGAMQVVTLSSGVVTAASSATGGLFGLALSPDGARLVGSRPGSGSVLFIDRATRAVLGSVATGGFPRRVAFDLLGSIVVVANESGWVDLIR